MDQILGDDDRLDEPGQAMNGMDLVCIIYMTNFCGGVSSSYFI